MKNEPSSGTSRENDRFTLPVGPSDLCFDRNEFLENSFSVDNFLHSHRKKANLETIRDDLGVYLKILRSAMIELINKDYADFVNLSSNLIGLDKAINGIQVPLGQLKEEVLQVKLTLDDCMNDVSQQLEQRRLLHAKKYKLRCLTSVSNLLHKLKSILQDGNKSLDPELVERAASEYNQLQFAISKCGTYNIESNKQESEVICNIITSNLNKMFLEAARNKEVSGMAHCLRIYVTLDKISYVEELFRKEIVASSLTNIISESSLASNPRGLSGVYSLILRFIDDNMSELLIITARKSATVVPGYDFLVNSFWPEVEERLEIHVASIYAPGNPEVFYKRYSETMEFLNVLDTYCGSQDHIQVLHDHPQYSAFLERWNLPVYFQIRFQEIAGSFETLVCDSKAKDILPPPSEFCLNATSRVWSCLLQCWADGIFLPQLGHRFWKLNLQLMARYNTWIGEVLREDQRMTVSVSQPESTVPTGTVKKTEDENSNMQFLICLHTDVQALAAKVPILEDKTVQKLRNVSAQSRQLLKNCFEESKQQVLSKLPVITQCIVQGLSCRSLSLLRQVSDIPRLYRRTNREMPTKPCAYVTQALAPASRFLKEHSARVNSKVLLDWLAQSFSAITEQYFSAVSDVLTSVQKTEESLRRLKKLRDRTAGSSGEPRGGGDDDKIRKQLALDVQSYCLGIVELGLTKDSVKKLGELLVLVDDASKSSADSSK